MTIAISTGAITISGTTSYETPDTILADSSVTDTVAELIAPHVLHIHGRNLIINGSWDDTSWTILFDQEQYPYTNSASATWKSGENKNGEYVGGANYILNVPSTSYTERTIVHTSSKLFWYGIEFFVYLPDPLGSLNSNTACRLVVTNTNTLSIINASFSSVGKGGYFKCGTNGVVENSIFFKGGIYLRPILGVEFDNFSMNGDADGNVDGVRIYFNDGTSGGSGGQLTIAGFVPRVASSGEIRIRNGNHFAPTGGVTRTTSLPDCVLDVTKLRLQGDQQTVSIDTNLEITVDGITTKSDVNVGVYNSDKSHDFAIKSLTNSQGVYTGKTIGDWTGYIFDSATDTDWLYPTSANRVDRRSKKIILRRFDLLEQITSPSIGATGKYETLIFMQDDDKVTGTKTQAAAIAGVAFDKTNEIITISEDTSLQDVYNYYKYWIALDAQLNLDNFMIVDGKILDLDDWDLIVNSSDTLSGSDGINKINTDGSITSNGTIDVPYVDSSGIVVTLTCNQASAKIYYQIDPDDGSTDTERYVDADGNGKYRVTGIPAASHVYVVAKKDGYDYYKTDFDPAVTSDVSLPLSSIDAVDTTISISGYVFHAGNTSNDNNLLFGYQTSGKSNIVFGEIDLDPATNAKRLSRRVFDHLWSLNSGMKFLNYWNRDGSITKLDGRPYKIAIGRISINTTKLEFTRLSGMTAAEKSYFGEYVANEDGDRYRAPQSNNDNVSISSLADLFEASPAVFREFAGYVTSDMDENSSKLTEIKSKVVSIELKTTNLPDNTSSKLNSMDTQIAAIDGVVDSNKTVLDKINFDADENVLAVDQHSTSAKFERTLIADDEDDKVYAYNEDLERDAEFDFSFHGDHQHAEGITEHKGRLYGLEGHGTNEVVIFLYSLFGVYERKFTLSLSPQGAEDISIDDENGIEVLRLLNNATTNKLVAYNLQTETEITSKDILLPGVENPLGFDIYDGHAYITDGRNNTNNPEWLRVVRLSDGGLDSSKSFNISAGGHLPTGVIVTSEFIRVVFESNRKIIDFAHNGNQIRTVDMPTEIADARGMVYIKSTPYDIKKLEGIMTKIEDDASLTRKHIVNTSEYVPSTSILHVKDDDGSSDIDTYDIKDESDNPTGTGVKAYKKLRK